MSQKSLASRVLAIVLSGAAIASSMATTARANEALCGPLDSIGQYGPFDYRNTSLVAERNVVERAHFTRSVETLERGNRGGLKDDLDYTLRAFPNHHRALQSMVRYYIGPGKETRPAMRYTAECYFDRALRLAPDDAIVWLLFGMYSLETGEKDKAVQYFERANTLAPQSADVQYNLGLMYLKLEQYDNAVTHAKTAYENGYPLPGLRQRLAALGKWPEE